MVANKKHDNYNKMGKRYAPKDQNIEISWLDASAAVYTAAHNASAPHGQLFLLRFNFYLGLGFSQCPATARVVLHFNSPKYNIVMVLHILSA